MVQNFTADPEVLKAACDRAVSSTSHAAEDRYGALDDLVDSIASCQSTFSPAACAEQQAAGYRDARTREADAILVSLGHLVRALAPIPDMKTIVLFSEGFTRTPAADAVDAASLALGPTVASGIALFSDPSIERGLDALVSAAAASRTAIFTINPGGAARHTAIGARSRGPTGANANRGPSVDLYRNSERNAQDSLAEMARRSGGVASQAGDPSAEMRRIGAQSAGLYTVGYSPSGNLEGRRRRELRIKVLRKGVEVQARRELPSQEIVPALTGELSQSVEACSERGRRGIRLSLRLDRKRLSFERSEANLSANFSVYLRIVEEGRPEPLHEEYHFYNVTSTAAEAAAGGLPDPTFDRSLVVPCRSLVAIVTATDAASGARGAFTTAIAP
jgi:VWFA-related protein